MKVKLLIISSIFLLIGAFVFKAPVTYVLAESDSDKIDNLQDDIEKYQKKISELQGKANTLANEIERMNSQIYLTETQIQQSVVKINKTQQQITDLIGDIDNLVFRIDKLVEAIDYQQEVLNNRLRARYKSRDDSAFFVIFGGNSLNQIIQRTEYLKVMEHQDNKLLSEMNATKEAYEKQKELLEQKKKEEEELKAQLEQEKANLDAYKAQLENTKAEKDRLLKLTQNDEQKYQQLLADAQKELEQIVLAVSVLKDQESKDVEKGDVIGVQGNSGYSFGDHLHFGVYRYGSFEDIEGWNWYYSNSVNPKKKLKSKTVYWDTGCESSGDKKVGEGDWSWPLKDPTISQGYGHTCYSDIYYGGKDHPAYDMYGSVGSLVYAAEDGEAYFCRNCLGDGGNGVFIFHDDDYMTLYWHLK